MYLCLAITWMNLAELLYVLQDSGLRSTITAADAASNKTSEADLELGCNSIDTFNLGHINWAPNWAKFSTRAL